MIITTTVLFYFLSKLSSTVSDVDSYLAFPGPNMATTEDSNFLGQMISSFYFFFYLALASRSISKIENVQIFRKVLIQL